MKSTILFKVRNSFIYISVLALMSTLVLGFAPTKSFAASSDELNDTGFKILEIIKFSDEVVVYKTLENGDVFLYEEYIEGDTVTTEKYKVENESKELVENFKTTTELNGDNITVTQEDILISKITSKTTVDILPAENVSDNLSINASVWVETRSAGNNYAYYKYASGGGLARELNYEKSIPLYHKDFDTFTRNVDSIKSFEVGVLKDLLLIGVLDQGFKSIKNPTVANVTEFLKKYVKSIPGVGVIAALVQYFNLVNKTMDSYELLSGVVRKWR